MIVTEESFKKDYDLKYEADGVTPAMVTYVKAYIDGEIIRGCDEMKKSSMMPYTISSIFWMKTARQMAIYRAQGLRL